MVEGRDRRRGRRTPVSTIERLEDRLLMAVNLTLNATQQYQTITGFGTALYNGTGAPYDAPVGSAPYEEFINDYVNDLGNNLLRIDCDPDVLPTQPATPLGTNLQANIAMLNFNSGNASFYGGMAEAINKAEGGKLQVFVTVWSPPAWMKANDSVSAVEQSDGTYNDPLNHLLFQDNAPADADDPNNNLDPAMTTQFARYCAAYVAGMEQNYGINIVGLSIQNELLFNEPYASCSYWQDPSLNPTDIQYKRYAEAIQAVGEEFETDGLTTQLVGPESVGPDGNSNQMTVRQMDYIQAVDDDTTVDSFGKTAADYLSTYAIHGWGNNGVNASSGVANWSQYESLLKAEPVSRPSWQTEESGEAPTWMGTNSNGSSNPLQGALGMALLLHDSLAYGDVSAYFYLSVTSGNLTGSTTNLMDSTDATVADPERTDVPQWKYLVFKHWSDFIPAGSVRIGTDFTDSSGDAIPEDPTTINAEAYLDTAGNSLTVELTNESASAQTVYFSLDGLGVNSFNQDWLTDSTNVWTDMGAVTFADGVAAVTVPAESVVTLVGTAGTGSVAGTVTSSTNGAAVPRQTVYLDLNNDGRLDPGDPQTTTAADGSFSFTGLLNGTYTARVVAPGWTPAPAGGVPFTVDQNQAAGVDFSLTPIAPVAAPGSGYSVPAGGSVTLNGSASTGPVAAYQWDLNYNGVTFDPTATGATPVFSAAGLNALTTHTVALEVTSINGLVSPIVTGTVSITEVAPTAVFTGTDITLGQPATAMFSGATDPSPADVAAGFTYNYNFNNGAFDVTTTSPSVVIPSADITATGSYSLVGTISDTDGGSTTYTSTVIVTSPMTAPLTGTVIGTTGSYHNDGNTAANAFDGNLNTFFDAPGASGNWIGLDLGVPTVITSIAYASRAGFASRMQGGIFQASNSPTFASGVVNLFTIPATALPPSNALARQTVTPTAPSRYVRYLAPANSYGNASEIQFFGTPLTRFTGMPIGTPGSYENLGDTIADAFDGNLNTFFDAPTANGTTANGNWAGLDLGTAQSVKAVSFAPRVNFTSRMVGGIFQASNSPTFATGVVNLYTITTAPPQDALTTVDVTTSVAYRYYRYLSPAGSYGNIAEINFYG